jgi:hypothetical protein
MAGALFDQEGNRKYLTAQERAAFLRGADRAPREVRTFCALLHYTAAASVKPWTSLMTGLIWPAG